MQIISNIISTIPLTSFSEAKPFLLSSVQSHPRKIVEEKHINFLSHHRKFNRVHLLSSIDFHILLCSSWIHGKLMLFCLFAHSITRKKERKTSKKKEASKKKRKKIFPDISDSSQSAFFPPAAAAALASFTTAERAFSVFAFDFHAAQNASQTRR